MTSILKSRMRQRGEETDGKKPGSSISVAARASFFKEEQQRAAKTLTNAKPALDRHPSATIPQVDKRDTEVCVCCLATVYCSRIIYRCFFAVAPTCRVASLNIP